MDKLTTNILQNWRTNSSVELLLHKYSLIVNSKAVWKKVEKALIDTIPKNRDGAASTEYAQELASELRLKHGHIWNGHEIAWSIWANTILTAPAHQHGSFKNDSTPTASCLDLFSIELAKLEIGRELISSPGIKYYGCVKKNTPPWP